MSGSQSPFNVSIDMYDQITGNSRDAGWLGDAENGIGSYSDELLVDADCSEQFHGLAIAGSDIAQMMSDGSEHMQEHMQAMASRTGTSAGVAVGSARAIIRCTICAKTFNNSSALAKHKLIHSEERKYTCPKCSKAFKRQDHLNGHLMTHSTEKPYKCKFLGCGKSYCDARSLRRHLDNVHQPQMDTNGMGEFVSTPHSASLKTPLTSGTSGSGQQGLVFTFDPPALSPAGDSNPNVDASSPGGLLSPSGALTPLPGGVWTGEGNPFDEPKPIKCTHCERRFKNLPALNGHMRLHGGYIKRPPDNGDDDAECQNTSKVRSSASSGCLNSDTVNIVKSILASAHSEASSGTVELAEGLHCVSGQASQPNLVLGWTDNKSIEAPNDLHTVIVDSSGLLNSAVFLPSQSSSNVANTIYVQMDTAAIKSMESLPAGDLQASVVGAESYPVVSQTSEVPTLPVLIGNDTINLPMMLTNSISLPTGLKSSDMTCPVMSDDDQAVSLHVTALPASTMVLVAPNTPGHQNSSAVPLAYELVQDLENQQSSVAFPSPCTPSLSTVASSPATGKASGLYQAADVICHTMAAFPTPQTPELSHLSASNQTCRFQFASITAGQGDAALQSKTPMVAVTLNQSGVGHQLFSPRTPFTPATPSVFQFPPAVIASHNSSVGSSSPFIVQKHHFHPYGISKLASAGDLTSPHFLRAQHDEALRKARERKKFEQDVAEFEHHLQQLKQENLGQQQQQQQVEVLSLKSCITSGVNSTKIDGIDLPDTAALIEPMDLLNGVDDDDVMQFLLESQVVMDTTQNDNFDAVNVLQPVKTSALQDSADLIPTDHQWLPNFRDPPSPKQPRRKQKPKPLVIPESMNNFRVMSGQLPASVPVTLVAGQVKPQLVPYTPPPMRSSLWNRSSCITVPRSAPPCHMSLSSFSSFEGSKVNNTDAQQPNLQPRINIGPHFQADMPAVRASDDEQICNGETLLWDPKIVEGLPEEELLNYQNFASSAATNREYALHLLQQCNGRIKDARLKLMHGAPRQLPDSPREEWSPGEVEKYSRALIDTNKDFTLVSKKVGSKSVKQCIQFYYMWKKVCSEEYELLCRVRRQLRDPTLCLFSDLNSSEIPSGTGQTVLVSKPS